MSILQSVVTGLLSQYFAQQYHSSTDTRNAYIYAACKLSTTCMYTIYMTTVCSFLMLSVRICMCLCVCVCVHVYVCLCVCRPGSNSSGGVAIALHCLFHRTEDRNECPCNHHGSYSPKGKLQQYIVIRKAACVHMAITYLFCMLSKAQSEIIYLWGQYSAIYTCPCIVVPYAVIQRPQIEENFFICLVRGNCLQKTFLRKADVTPCGTTYGFPVAARVHVMSTATLKWLGWCSVRDLKGMVSHNCCFN